MKGNPKKAAEFAVKADNVIKDPKLIQRPKMLLNKIWVEAYNAGVDNFNRYFQTKQAKFLDSAINNFEVGKSIRPEMLDFYNFLGQVYENKGDSISAMEEYQLYLDKAKGDLEIFSNKGLFISMPRADVVAKLGKPVSSTGLLSNQQDSLLTDIYSVDSKDLYVFYKDNKKDKNFMLEGIRFNPPATWLPGEQSQWSTFNTGPIGALAQNFYFKNKYQDALKYLKLLGTLEPMNTNVNSFMVQIYQDLGKLEDAYSYINQLITKEPKNKYYLTQLGDLYQTDKKFPDAISTYKRALEVDPYFESAVRNIASAFKNKASLKQVEIKTKIDADKNYKPNPEDYFPDLRESAKYFEQVSKTDKYRNDYKVFSELANIYYVLDDKAKLNNAIEKLESLEATITAAEKEYYYLDMMKIFSNLKNQEKTEYYRNKLK
jgi:tetratricopeptide (TPR) repeat protein